MPPQRHPLRQTNGNQRSKHHELTPYERGRIQGAADAGLSHSKIGALIKCVKATVTKTLQRAGSRLNGQSKPRSGRPQKYSDRDQRAMLRNLRLEPKLTFKQRQEVTGLKMSNSYIKGLARINNLSYWCAKQHPKLTEANTAARLL
jgi:transposase